MKIDLTKKQIDYLYNQLSSGMGDSWDNKEADMKKRIMERLKVKSE